MKRIVKVIKRNKIPRIRFCHECGNKLRERHRAIVEFDNHDLIYHLNRVNTLRKKLTGNSIKNF